ncbi:Ribokinase-like protein [Pisolithus orientalis]|uniref:Ribokinase-like protein n=1 Tax=Pisolithus orientalis TaxID=936130 RepID=UPI0022254C6E|nr:Ribokinase-like protein [Pisolithus orientalis]KAI6035433.1 Ribokinase-like protein [Pisolithus orientalis]
MADAPDFVTLGMFIIDEFSFTDQNGKPTGKTLPSQIGGGGTYAAIGARIWLPPHRVGMIVDRGNDFPQDVQDKLLSYGANIWHFRNRDDRGTTRALNSYRGLTPRDLHETRFAWPRALHFICSPTRALEIISEVEQVDRWEPTMIFEPIPYRCVPEELPSLVKVLPFISVLSPNAEEALSLLSMPTPVTKESVETAAVRFLNMGMGSAGKGCVIIRSGALGAYLATKASGGQWVDAFWTPNDNGKVIDVTGAGNSFLGGLAAGLLLTGGDFCEGKSTHFWGICVVSQQRGVATLYAAVSASFVIEQSGLPVLKWNNDIPQRRVDALRQRHLQLDKIRNKDH